MGSKNIVVGGTDTILKGKLSMSLTIKETQMQVSNLSFLRVSPSVYKASQ